MELTKHALMRCQQRGIPFNEVQLILQYGKEKRMPGNAFEYKIHKKDMAKMITNLKRLINKIEKMKDKAILICDEKIITVYKTYN